MVTEIAVFTKHLENNVNKFYNLALQTLGTVYNFSLVRFSPHKYLQHLPVTCFER